MAVIIRPRGSCSLALPATEERVEQRLEILQAVEGKVEGKNVQNLIQALAKHIDFNNTVYACRAGY
ncbi:MAG: hypothetical protein LBJ36_10410 [Synergistaceae bacterium]|nr:hypothetical protein [Synergistaceae bacterium]